MSDAGELCVELVAAFWAHAQTWLVASALLAALVALTAWRIHTRHQRYNQQEKE